MEQTLTAELLLREIYQAETELRWFEQKYSLLSETFYRLYEQGQLRDEDPAEIREYLEWSGWYEIYQSRLCERALRYLDSAVSASKAYAVVSVFGSPSGMPSRL